MSRADEFLADADRWAAVLRLEDELGKLKAAKKTDQARLREAKLELREARRVYREQRAGEVPDGDAAVSPDTVAASAAVKEV